MPHAKLGVLACGAIGLVGAFLPFVAGDFESSLWAARTTADAARIYTCLLAFAGAIAAGALGVRSGMVRWKACVAIVSFAYVIFMFRRGVSGTGTPLELFRYAIGAKLVALGALGGLVSSIVCASRPEVLEQPSVVT